MNNNNERSRGGLLISVCNISWMLPLSHGLSPTVCFVGQAAPSTFSASAICCNSCALLLLPLPDRSALFTACNAPKVCCPWLHLNTTTVYKLQATSLSSTQVLMLLAYHPARQAVSVLSSLGRMTPVEQATFSTLGQVCEAMFMAGMCHFD